MANVAKKLFRKSGESENPENAENVEGTAVQDGTTPEAPADGKAARKPRVKVEHPTVIPEFFDDQNVLKALKSADFPISREGKIAYCNYVIEQQKAKITAIEAGKVRATDPKGKIVNKMSKLQAMIAELQKQLADMNGEATAVAQAAEAVEDAVQQG